MFDAMVSFHYNTGAIAKSSILRLTNLGQFKEAAAAFDKWRKPKEIIPRRNKEKALYSTGKYQNGGFATIYPADSKGRVNWSKGERINLTDYIKEV